MTARRATFTDAELRRAMKAARAIDPGAVVELAPGGIIRILPAGLQPAPALDKELEDYFRK